MVLPGQLRFGELDPGPELDLIENVLELGICEFLAVIRRHLRQPVQRHPGKPAGEHAGANLIEQFELLLAVPDAARTAARRIVDSLEGRDPLDHAHWTGVVKRGGLLGIAGALGAKPSAPPPTRLARRTAAESTRPEPLISMAHLLVAKAAARPAPGMLNRTPRIMGAQPLPPR